MKSMKVMKINNYFYFMFFKSFMVNTRETRT
jgi:hypothetical protein